ncbi:Uncharacterised protein (plasmid) [Mesomycoplasma conjunctivae]|nr:Uncharacterised protein [Mycoplasmopsis fermentans]VEU66752.1 Uncharacterised protein [Mesomycoplasma conjunctivae]
MNKMPWESEEVEYKKSTCELKRIDYFFNRNAQ